MPTITMVRAALVALVAILLESTALTGQMLGMFGGGASAFPSGAVACWNLDEASGTRNDSIGTSHLTDNNTVTQAAGVVGNAAEFTAANNEYLSIADNAALSTGDIDFTIAIWVRPSTVGTFAIATKLNSGGPGEWQMVSLAGGAARFNIFNSSAPVGAATTAAGALVDATWALIVGWHDSVNDLVGISVNNATPVTAATTGSPVDTAIGFTLGSYIDGSTNWNGREDVAAMWKRVLTSDERTSLYNSGNGRACP